MSLSFGIGIVGFIISIATTNIAARYVSMWVTSNIHADAALSIYQVPDGAVVCGIHCTVRMGEQHDSATSV